MKPERRSQLLLAITRSKAKMYEYGLTETEHIKVKRNPSYLLRLAVGLLGDIAAAEARSGSDTASERKELAQSVRFSARFFDAYVQTRMAEVTDAHLKVLAASAYYLCDLPGTSSVLIKGIVPEQFTIDAGGLETLVAWLLVGDFTKQLARATGGQVPSSV